MRRSDYQNPGTGPGDPSAGDAVGQRLALQQLWSGLGLQVVATEWQREVHPPHSEFVPGYAAIEIMRSGCFEKRTGHERLLVDPGLVVFHEAHEPFGIRHPCGTRNAGTTLRVGAGTLDELGRTRFRSRWAPSPASFALSTHWLTRALRTRDADPLVLEEAVVRLVEAALALDAAGTGDGRAVPPVARSRVRRVQAFLNESFARPLRLSDVARAADCSVWHACKLFRRATGSTIHGWLARLRLRHALAALDDGARDLTVVALDAGFSSHSHFTAAFRAEFGVTPSATRARERVRRQSASVDRSVTGRRVELHPQPSQRTLARWRDRRP